MQSKQKKKANQNIVFVVISIFIIMIVYFAITIVRFFEKPVNTVLIKKGELTNYEEVTGYIIRNEMIVDSSSFDGVIKEKVPDASRVAKDSPIATYVSRSEEQLLQKIAKLDEKIDKAIESQRTIYPNDVKTIDSEIETYIYSNVKNNTNMASIGEYKEYLNGKVEKKAKIVGELSPVGSELKTLINERAAYEAELNNSEKTLNSPCSGLVSYRVDGLENIFTYENISLLTSEKLKSQKTTLDQIVPISKNKIKVVDNFECYIAVQMDSDEAKNVKLNDVVYLRFKNTGDLLVTATVDCISKEDDSVLLVFKVKSNVEELTKYRKIGLDVVWWRSTGLKVNKKAIYYSEVPVNINVENESGETVQINNTMIKLPTIKIKKTYYEDEVFVKILKKTDEYVIIDNYTDAELEEMGMQKSLINTRKTLKMYDEVLIIS